MTMPQPVPMRNQPRPNAADHAKLWILHGAAWLALMIYVWTAWVVSGDFRTNTTGRGSEPDWYVALIRGWEVFALVVSLVILWWFVVRPKLRTGRFGFDALFFLGCMALCFQEPWINWTAPQFLYSTTSINFGSWTAHIPGWTSPNSELVPLSLWALSAYFWLVGIPAYAGSRFMRRLRTRNAGLSNLRLVGYTYLAFCVFDVLLESFITRTQLFSYGSTVPALTLWAGTDHQFPIYETISWAGTYTVLASLHFFRDDRGRSLPERGIDKLRITSGRLRTFAQFLAIMGACQAGMLFTYNIPYAYWGMHAVMAEPFVAREWRTAGVCGPKTAYDCPAPNLPIARIGSPTNRIDR
ncbi:spirocyclase AveC family protein [Pseudonocardia eucalypti]|uniref:Spirocyclase AveC family protein n=1 Tax=Pseudonocardia eucalypti TaxID=648755 RepID=A0ABP9QNG3_9PSEU|nr:hypothetical protein [Pseudonocardia eucalypti]